MEDSVSDLEALRGGPQKRICAVYIFMDVRRHLSSCPGTSLGITLRRGVSEGGIIMSLLGSHGVFRSKLKLLVRANHIGVYTELLHTPLDVPR